MAKYLGLLLLVLFSACRESPPPPIEVCILSDVGYADCVEPDGTKKIRLPSELNGYWATSGADMQAWSSWCYQTTSSNTHEAMEIIASRIHP
jgi:hypothetical protein